MLSLKWPPLTQLLFFFVFEGVAKMAVLTTDSLRGPDLGFWREVVWGGARSILLPCQRPGYVDRLPEC